MFCDLLKQLTILHTTVIIVIHYIFLFIKVLVESFNDCTFKSIKKNEMFTLSLFYYKKCPLKHFFGSVIASQFFFTRKFIKNSQNRIGFKMFIQVSFSLTQNSPTHIHCCFFTLVLNGLLNAWHNSWNKVSVFMSVSRLMVV